MAVSSGVPLADCVQQQLALKTIQTATGQAIAEARAEAIVKRVEQRISRLFVEHNDSLLAWRIESALEMIDLQTKIMKATQRAIHQAIHQFHEAYPKAKSKSVNPVIAKLD